MEATSLIQTGRTVALQTAHDAVTRIIKKTPTMLMNENSGVNYPTLRRIKDGQPVKSATYAFYMELFLRLLRNEYHQRIQKGDTGREILHVFAEIAFLEHNMNLDYQP